MTVDGSERDSAKTCNTDGCNAWATEQSDRTRCRHHGGESTGPQTEAGKKSVRSNAVKHGLHTSAEVFLQEADEHHRDTYHATYESLCTRYEQAHGKEPPHHAQVQLSQVALDMAKLQMAAEYEKERAIDADKPLTERQVEDIGGEVMQVERVNKIESLKTDIRRENRLLLKDMGIYESPDQQQADATQTIAAVMQEELNE